ncbi:MAG: type II toxin-antitoxin system Phd/YefM family antitoxin [Desulfovibrionaceae bacterium]|nr:type II toxin-antitoxin system Phd/YefM family antitoxin [Desulfovibrionaceae bacterium]
MQAAQVKTITSSEFLHNVSAAQRVVNSGGTVIVTSRGKERMALIPIESYRNPAPKTSKEKTNIVALLEMPEAAAYDHVDFEPVRLIAQDVDGQDE